MTDQFEYDSAASDAGGPQPGAKSLRQYMAQHYPPAERFMGIYNNRNVRGSETQKSLHAEGRALDWRFSANEEKSKAEAMQFINQLLANEAQQAKQMGIQEVIFNRKIWSAQHPQDGLRDYNGVNPHTDHVHIGLNLNGAQKKTSFWRSYPN